MVNIDNFKSLSSSLSLDANAASTGFLTKYSEFDLQTSPPAMARVCQNEPEAGLIIHPRSQSRLQVNIVITAISQLDISTAGCNYHYFTT